MNQQQSHELSDESFGSEVIKAREPVLVGFYGNDEKSHDYVIKPLEALAADKPGSIKLCSLNAERFSSFTSEYDLQALPAFVLFKNGEVLQRVFGPISAQLLRVFVSRYSY